MTYRQIIMSTKEIDYEETPSDIHLPVCTNFWMYNLGNYDWKLHFVFKWTTNMPGRLN